MRRRSLTTRLTLSHMLVTLAALLLLGATLLALVQRSQRAQTLAALSTQAQVVAASASQLADDPTRLAAIAPTLARSFVVAGDTTLRVFAPNSSVVYASHDLGNFPSSATLPLLTNPLPIQPVALETNRRFVAEPIRIGDQTIGVIELSQSTARERALLQQLTRALLGGAAIALTGAAIVGHMLARSLVRPLHRLGRVADAIAGGDTDTRSTDRSPDEIGQVAARLNSMADQLQARLSEVERLAAARQSFYRTVSHELRTPLTAIRGMTENLEDDATPEQRPSLLVIGTEAERLQRLVEELLNPRDELPQPLRRRQPVALGELVTEARRIMQPRADRAGVQLIVNSRSDLVVAGDRDRLKQALLNLLDNALTWTPPGGTVAIELERQAAAADLVVNDSGPGIPVADRDRVWQRGYSTSGGQGVGLSLVREIAEAHDGDAALRDGAGTTIAITLPLLLPPRT